MLKLQLSIFLSFFYLLSGAQTTFTIVSFTNNETCSGSCNGSVIVSQVTGGTPPYLYLWSNGSTTPSIYNLCPGTETLVITDDLGVTDTFTFNLTGPPPLQVTTSNPSLVCEGDTFMVDFNLSGGVPPYSIAFQTQPIDTIINVYSYRFAAQANQSYSYSISDSNSCSVSQPIDVTVTSSSRLTGQVYLNNTLDYLGASDSVKVTLLKTRPANIVWEVKEVQYLYEQDTEKRFSFNIPDTGRYVILTKVFSDNLQGIAIPTCSGNKHLWSRAIPDVFTGGCIVKSLDIQLINTIDSLPGTGSIEGTIYLTDFFKTEASSEPIPLIDVVIEKDSTPSISTDNLTSFFPWSSAYAYELAPGTNIFPYKIPQLPNGTYKVKVQIPGIPMIANYPLGFTTIDNTNDSISSINFCADSFLLGSIDTCISNATVNVFNQEKSAFVMYPNPTDGKLTIRFYNQNQQTTLSLYSLAGEKIISLPILDQTPIDLSPLQLNGMYFAEIYSNDEIHIQKVFFQTQSN